MKNKIIKIKNAKDYIKNTILNIKLSKVCLKHNTNFYKGEL